MTKIQILGIGCAKCTQLGKNALSAANDLGIDYEFEKVTDINQIMAFGVMMTPALVVNGQVKLAGKLANIDQIKRLLTE
ncbi:MAG: thioredoxin family protein [Planctomycetota bacterium]